MPFDARCVEIATALASQAAVAIENGRLYEDIERLFEGFVTAAVTAIESRDPTTSGHSGRVATMTVRSPRRWIASASGPVSRRALHARAAARAALRRPAARLRQGRRARAGAGEGEEALSARPRPDPASLRLPRSAHGARVRARARRAAPRGAAAPLRRRARAARVRAAHSGARSSRASSTPIVQANEPTVLAEGSFEALEAIGRRTYVDFDGASVRCSRITSCSSS